MGGCFSDSGSFNDRISFIGDVIFIEGYIGDFIWGSWY